MISKYETVYPLLKKKFSGLPSGSKVPPIRELMQQFEVSQITIDKAMKMIRMDGIIESIPGKGTFIRNKDNHAATTTTHIREIGILIPSYNGLFINNVGQYLDEAFRHQEWHVRKIIYDWEQGLNSSLGLHCCDGIVLLPAKQSVSISEISFLASLQVPFVIVNLPLLDLEVNSVSTDNYQGGRLAAKHLQECGYRRMGIIATEPVNSIVQARIDGFRSCCPDSRLFDSGTVYGENAHCKAYEITRREINQGCDCDAFFVMSDDSALGVLKALHDSEMKIPEEIGVIGFDGSPESAYYHPALTTVGHDYQGWAQAMVKHFNEALHGGNDPAIKHIVIQPKLLIRASTRNKNIPKIS